MLQRAGRPAGGIQHFYHVKRGGCRYEAETLEHLQAKLVIAEAARSAGWAVETEAEDEMGRWKADVLAERGRHKIAFEVQWSGQTWAETIQRQQRYEDSDVRGLWLLRRPTYEPVKHTPAFQLRKAEDTVSGFEVLISPPKEAWTDHRAYPDDWFDLGVFVASALKRGLVWAPAERARRFDLSFAVHQVHRPCTCGTQIVVPYSMTAVPSDLECHRPYAWHHNQRWRYPPVWLTAFSRYANERLMPEKIAYAKSLDERTGGQRFVWHCSSCDAVSPIAAGDRKTIEIKGAELGALPAPTPRSPEARFCHRWWIDPESFGR